MIADVQKAFNPFITSLGYDVAWPNVQAKYNDMHLAVSYLYSRSEPSTYKSSRQPGILQISIYEPDGKGSINAGEIAESIVDYFPMGSVIVEGNSEIHIDQTPYASPPIIGDGWYHLPVNVPFEVYK